MASAIFAACVMSSMTPGNPGTVATPAACASFFDSILSPIASMAFGFGPMKVMLLASNARANAACSDKKP